MTPKIKIVQCDSLKEVEDLIDDNTAVIFVHKGRRTTTNNRKQTVTTELTEDGNINYHAKRAILAKIIEYDNIILCTNIKAKKNGIHGTVHTISNVFRNIKNIVNKPHGIGDKYNKIFLEFISIYRSMVEEDAVMIAKYIEPRDVRDYKKLDRLVTIIDGNGKEHNAILRGSKSLIEEAVQSLNVIDYKISTVSIWEREMFKVRKYDSLRAATKFLNSVKVEKEVVETAILA